MEAATAQVLFDVATLGVGALVIGLGIFAYVRRRDSHIGWHYHGNVWTEPFDVYDLAAAGLIIAYFYTAIVLNLRSGGTATEAADPAESPLNDVGLLITLTAFTIVMGAGVFAFATILRGRDPVQLFGLRTLSAGRVTLWAVGTLVATYAILLVISGLFWTPFIEKVWDPDPELQDAVQVLGNTSDWALRAVMIFSAVIVAPLTEELIFRGYLYAVVKRFSDRFFSAITTAALFAVVHPDVPTLLPLFVLGLILAAAYELSGSLWVPIFVHAGFNLINTIGILWAGGS